MSPSSPNAQPASLADRQDAITRALREMKRQAALSQAMRAGLERAETSSDAAAAALASRMAPEAGAAAQRAMADLESALKDLVGRAAASEEQALREAQADLNRAKSLAEARQEAEAGEQTQVAIARLSDEAVRQNESGSQQSAERLGSLAQAIDQMRIPETLMRGGEPGRQEGIGGIERAIRLVADARGQGQTRAEQLADATARLKDLERQLGELTEGEGEPSPEALRGIEEQLRLAVQDVALAAERVAESQDDRSDPSDAVASGGAAGSGRLEGARAIALGLRQQANRMGATVDSNPLAERPLISTVRMGIRDLVVASRRLLEQLEKVELVRAFDPEEVPAEYRDDVSLYFERLSDTRGQ